jgi:hypothetical protein
MDRFRALPRGGQIMLVASVLLLACTFFPWQRVEVLDFAAATANAWNGFWGVLLGLLTLALVAWFALRLGGVELRLPVSDALLGAAFGTLILLAALLKVLTDDFTAVWAWIGLILAAVVAVGGWLTVQEAGGVDTLRSEASGMRGGGGAATTPTSPPAAPAAPPPAPPAGPPAEPAAAPAPEAPPPEAESPPPDERTT